jgi:hypothetical protein
MPTIQENWPFDDSPNLAVITTRQITDQGVPILFVSHDGNDGGWQFLTGGPLIEEDARVVALRRIWTLDPSVGELADLPLGWQASRGTVREKWRRGPRSGQ